MKKSAAPDSSGPGAARGFRLLSRRGRLLIGVALLSAVSAAAFLQKPHPDAWRQVETFSLDWWTNRWERNAFLRGPVIDADIRDIFWLPDSELVWAVGAEGFIVHSADGGASWRKQDSGLEPNDLVARPFTDRGGSLQRAGGPVERRVPNLHSVHFVNPTHGWAVGEAATVVATSDGGRTWVRQWVGDRPVDSNLDLNAVYFVNTARGWSVGTDGVVLATSDGGATWDEQSSGVYATLNDVHFHSDGLRGWAVGDYGTKIRTEDGGEYWLDADRPPAKAASIDRPWRLVPASLQSSQAPMGGGTPPDLYAVHFLNDGRRGWVAGSASLSKTDDGGETWYGPARSFPSVTKIKDLFFARDGRRGWAAADPMGLLTTTDFGESWLPLDSPPTGNGFSSVVLDSDARRGLLGFKRGPLKTTDGGVVWRRSRPSIRCVAPLADGRGVWAVGDYGTSLASFDGGDSWSRVDDGLALNESFQACEVFGDSVFVASGSRTVVSARVRGWWGSETEWEAVEPFPVRSALTPAYSLATILAADFIEEGNGWAATAFGWVKSSDWGRTWSELGPWTQVTGQLARDMQFIDAQRGWVIGRAIVGRPNEILFTNDGGTKFKPVRSGISNPRKLQFLKDGQRGWVLSETAIHATADGGQSWETQTEGVFNAIQILEDGLRGWAVGPGGAMVSTSDGGKTWTKLESPVEVDLHSVRFLEDGLRGWATGDQATILSTRDGGKTWTQPQYRNWPAPWYFLSSALILLVVVLPALRRPEPAAKRSVADVLASDRPIRRGDPDPLDFDRIAGGVSRFLANEKTEPPLTLAVKGKWGTGKSSLMNLIRDDLKSYGFPTVWFNAWHYQTEEHLLGSLMENIQGQAIPAWWTPSGLAFRIRLLYIRGAKHWLPTAVLAFFFAGLIHYLVEDWSRWEGLQASLKELASMDFSQLSQQWGPILALLTAIFGPLLAIQRGTRTFASTTSGFLAVIFGAFRIDTLEGDVGFRERFANTFRDATRALKPRKLTIFIDDLDRCQPDKTVRVLELINFLVVSGDCFVVVGMAPDWVVRSVGLGFKEVAAEMIEAPSEEPGALRLVKPEAKPKDGPDRAKEIRQEFARNYLEKLINIEVPLPRPSSEAAGLLLRPPEPPVYAGWERLRRQTVGLVQRYAPMAALALLVGLGYWQGPHLLTGPKAPPPALATVDSTPRTSVAPPSTDPGSGAVREGDQPAAPEVVRPSIFKPGQSHQPPWWPAAAGILLVLTLGGLRLALGPKRLEKDSPAFRKALEDWYPLVYHDRATPRSVKRFLNRVRYYAMRQRNREEPVSVWRKWRQAVKAKLGFGGAPEEEPQSSPAWIPEDVLVALSAIQEAYPDAVAEDEIGDFAKFLETRQNLPEMMKERIDSIRSYPDPGPYLERFRTMAEGIDIRR